MLDDQNVLKQRDSENVLEAVAQQFEQTDMAIEVLQPDHDSRPIANIVLVGMGGSALAGEFVEAWLSEELRVPFEIVHSYTLPRFVNENTLVIFSSCSGNTEEVLSGLEIAKERKAQMAIVAGGGQLAEIAERESITHILLPPIKIQPRLLTFIQVRALVSLLGHFGCLDAERRLEEFAETKPWLQRQSALWQKDVPVDKNYAKQLALMAVGKSAVFYGGQLTKSVAYKWKISWNENAKNIAFFNEYPEFNHNEFIGWSSHPIEKPYVIFDLVSNFEHPQILKRFRVSDRLLSGQRPKANEIMLEGDTLLHQLLGGHVLADFASTYTGVLNGVDPGPVLLANKLKEALRSE